MSLRLKRFMMLIAGFLVFVWLFGGVHLEAAGADEAGSSPSTAFIVANGGQEALVTSQGYVWYKLYMYPNGAYKVSVPGATNISFIERDGTTTLKTCSGSVCEYTPWSAWPTTYAVERYIKVDGPPGAATTVTLENGASFAGAYQVELDNAGGYNSSTRSIAGAPGGAEVYYKVTLTSGQPYVLTSSGTQITMYDSAQTAVKTFASPQAVFTPTATGSYYIKLSGVSSSYTFSVGEGGGQTYSAYNVTPGVQESAITTRGYSWYKLYMYPNGTYKVTVPGATSISFIESDGTTTLKTCSGSACEYTLWSPWPPKYAGERYIKVDGPPGAATTVTLENGASFAGAYSISLVDGVESASLHTALANTSVLHRADLVNGYSYTVTAVGFTITVYDLEKRVVSGPIQDLVTFTASISATHYFELKAPITGAYTLRLSQAVDTELPTISWVTPDDDAIISGQDVEFTVSATDNVTVSRVHFSVSEGTEVDVFGSSSTFGLRFASTIRQNGFHTIIATAYDSQGNTNSVSRSFFIFNVEDPDIGINRFTPESPDVGILLTDLGRSQATFSYNAPPGYETTVRVADWADGRVVWQASTGSSSAAARLDTSGI